MSGSEGRVLFVHPGAELYGSDRMALQTIEGLIAGGFAVEVVLPEGGALSESLNELGVVVHLVDAPILRKEYLKPGRWFWFAKQNIRGMRTTTRMLAHVDVDLVIANTMTQPIWMLAARLKRRRLIVHVREAEVSAPRLLRMLLVAPLRLAHRVIANSESTKSFIVCSRLFPGTTPVVIYNGKDWSPYQSAPKPIGSPVVLTLVGRVSPRKGQDIAVHALAQLVQDGFDVHLVIVGDTFAGYEWYLEELRTLIADLGLVDRVQFAGFQEDVRDALSAADIVVVPSRLEPFGTVAVEAMAASRPVVVSDAQGLAEIVQDGKNGRVFPVGDFGRLADAVADLLRNPDRATVLVEAGSRSVAERFSREQYATSIDRVVRETIG